MRVSMVLELHSSMATSGADAEHAVRAACAVKAALAPAGQAQEDFRLDRCDHTSITHVARFFFGLTVRLTSTETCETCATGTFTLTSQFASSLNMAALPGYQQLDVAPVLEGSTQQLVQLVIDAIKSGKKKVGGWVC